MQTAAIDAGPGDFRSLALQIRSTGLLERRPGYYTVKIALTIAALAAGWAALVLVGNSWAALGIAVFLGVMFTQLGFVGHDAGHRQVFGSRRGNRLLGLVVGNCLIGMSFGWWVPKHDLHHAHPNQIGLDPDIGDGVVAPTSTDESAEGGGRKPFLERHQALFFFPLMVLRSTGIHVLGIQRLCKRRDRVAAVEGLLIALHFTLYLAVVFWVLSPVKAVAFIVVQQVVFSVYLGCSFDPNHKAMPVLETDVQMSFARRQVITARNVFGGRFTNLLLGGLNYQIEHHLFPTMPRPNLARAQGMVRAFCLESGFGYCETSLFGSYRQTIAYLRGRAGTPVLVPQGATGA